MQLMSGYLKDKMVPTEGKREGFFLYLSWPNSSSTIVVSETLEKWKLSSAVFAMVGTEPKG